MKQTLLTLIVTFIYLGVVAQNPCTPIGADRCRNAPLINSCQLNGWYSNTDPPDFNYTDNNDIQNDPGWCNGNFSIENNQWLRFTAIEDHLFIDVDVSGCDAGNGIQMGAYELVDDNGRCPGAQINCFGLASGQNTSLVFEIENLIPGVEYLLMIDGWAGDGCPFLLNIVSGIPLTVEVEATPLPICPGVDALGALNAQVTAGGGNNVLYGWSTENGNIVSGDFDLNPIIDEPGDYTFTAYNVTTCCWASQTVTVTTTTDLPYAEASVIQHLGCDTPTASVTAEGSETDNGFNVFEYIWTFENGNPAGEGFTFEGLIYPGIYILTVRNVSTGCESQVQIEVLEDMTEPAIELLSPPILTCQDSTIFLSLDAPIGSTFEWSGDDAGFTSNEQAPEIIEAGIYSVTVTGANGCTSKAEIEVTEDLEEPTLQVVAPVLDCNNMSAAVIILNDNDETTYSWTGANGFSSIEREPTADEPGTYFLVATNPNGCSNDYIVQIEEDITPPEVSINPADMLTCDLIAFSLNYNSPDDIVSVQWTGPNGFESDANAPLVNQQGTFNLVVTDDKGCTNSTSITIEEDKSKPTLDLSPDGIITCSNDMVTLSGQSDDDITSYNWSNDLGTESTAAVSAAGQYFVTITGSNGCTNIAEVTVDDNFDEPIPNAGPDAIITCAQTETSLTGLGTSTTGAGLSYEWSLNGNLIGDTESINVSATGTYTLTITDLENGCTAMDEVVVNADENLPEVIIEDIGTLNCNTSSVLLSGTNSTSGNDISYSWLDPNQNIIGSDTDINVDQAGVYTFVVTNNTNGCQSELIVQVVDDFIKPDPIVNNQDILNCTLTSVNLEVQELNNLSNITFQWYDSNTNTLIGQGSSIDITTAGNYNVIAINMDNGCEEQFPISISENFNEPIADAGQPFTITCNETEATLDGSGSQGSTLTYAWYDQNQVLISEESVFNTDDSGVYILIVTDTESGCTDESSVVIDINADFPDIVVTPTTTLNCTQPTTNLDASNSQGLGNLTYTWYDENNNVISTDAIYEVDLAGNYLVEVTDTDSDCTSTFPIEVIEDFELPSVDAGPDQIISCDISSVMLDGSASSIGSDFAYQWYNSNNILVGITPMIEVENPDQYTLVIFSISNGCSNSADVNVTPDENIPVVDIDLDGVLSCLDTEVSVFSTLPANPDYSYEWQNESGTIVSEEITFTTEISGIYTLTILDQNNGCSNANSIIVEENFDSPDLTSSTPDVLNCNNASVQLMASDNNQANDLSYQWQDQDQNTLGTDATLDVNTPGTYTLTAISQTSGCSNSVELTVLDNYDIEVPIPTVSNILDCNNRNAQLSADNPNTSGYLYAWYDQQGNLVNEGFEYETTSPGEYNIIATNLENGCTESASIILAEDINIPNVNIPAVEELNCQVVELLLVGESDMESNFSYAWLDEQGNIIGTELELLVDEPGIYELATTNNDNGCANNSFIEVMENISTPNALIDDLSPLGLSCTQQSILLDGSNSTPAGNLQYEWFDENGNLIGTEAIYEATAPGEYQLFITDLTTFCTNANTSIIVQNDDLPTVEIAPPAVLNCNTSEVVLDASQSDIGSEFSYDWTTPNGATFNDNDVLFPTASTPGTYILTVTNTSTGCSNQFEIVVGADYAEPEAQANANGEFDCVTSEVQISALGSSQGSEYNYTWNIDGITFTNLDFVTVQSPGQYSLIVTNTLNGCTSETLVTVNENTERPTDFGITEDDITCHGYDDGFFQVNSIVGGTPPYTFAIDEELFEGLPTVSDLAPGNYPLLVTDALGCTLETSINIEEPPQVLVNLSEDITINLGESTFLVANSNVEQIEWFSQDSLNCVQNCFIQEVNPVETTVYEVEVMDENGCIASDNVVVEVQFDRAVYIPNAFSPNGDGFNDFFRIFGNSAVLQVKSMLIADRWGEIVYEAENIDLADEQRFWNGVHRGKDMNNDVLVYYVVVEYIDGQTEEFKGDVTLMR